MELWMVVVRKSTMRLCAAILLILTFILISGCKNIGHIAVVKSQSYYSSFEVVNQKVYIKCFVTIQNSTDQECHITLSGDFPDDVNKLITTKTLNCLEQNNKLSIFDIPVGATKSFYAIFVGNFAGESQKFDRSLPKIEIKSID